MNISAEDAQLIKDTMQRYGISEAEAIVSAERRKVYGDPEINHKGIAMAWAGLLQPWALRIARMDPLPPHVVANMMSALKSNRKRMCFHDDNYIDAAVYDGFARAWQKEWDENPNTEKPIVIQPAPSDTAVLVIRWSESAKPEADHYGHTAKGQGAVDIVWTENQRLQRQLKALLAFCEQQSPEFAVKAQTVVGMTT